MNVKNSEREFSEEEKRRIFVNVMLLISCCFFSFQATKNSQEDILSDNKQQTQDKLEKKQT